MSHDEEDRQKKKATKQQQQKEAGIAVEKAIINFSFRLFPWRFPWHLADEGVDWFLWL
jgi:hypothetical protein